MKKFIYKEIIIACLSLFSFLVSADQKTNVLRYCTQCKKEYKECLRTCKNAKEDNIETEECEDSYRECYNLHRCYVKGMI